MAGALGLASAGCSPPPPGGKAVLLGSVWGLVEEVAGEEGDAFTTGFVTRPENYSGSPSPPPAPQQLAGMN